MSPERIENYYQKLQKLTSKKGFLFNKDQEKVRELLESLLINMERYGYASCPCRLAAGKYELDKDIICPCVYAKPDIAEYGACYCALYVSKDWNQDRIPHVEVPERRPQEKIDAALKGLV
ncbi:MAG: ferredoxin-thioredoxin reductase catalytic domain-containing protein [Thermodesulfobacteriota bacterium]